jgi:16S rRNA (guanine966-N2)-methyltransferase
MEALSRGAASCVFFEAGQEIHELLQGNVRTIAPEARAICWRTDIRRTSFRPRGGDDCIPYSLIFFDPPYRIADQIRARGSLAPCLKLLSRSTLSTPEAILVIRTPEHFEAPEVAGWVVHDCWEMSSMMIWILVKPDAFVEDREEARMGAAGRAAEATVAGESNTDGNEGDDLDAAEDEYEDDDEEFGDD